MGDCVCLEKCPFFNDKMGDKPATAEMMKRRYCTGKYAECARYIVFNSLGRELVPVDLYPNQRDRALDLLKKKS